MPRRFAVGDALLILLILFGSWYFWQRMQRTEGSKVIISVSGSPYGWWYLPTEADTISLQGVMKIVMTAKGVRVVQADCPRQICVRNGLISLGGRSIVCVPNKIIIQLESDSLQVDGVVQ